MFFGQAWETKSTPTITSIGNNTYQVTNSTGSFIVNGTESTLEYEGSNLIFGISLTEGIMASLVAIMAFGGAIGIKVLDSGISEFSQKIIFNGSFYGGLWAIFSILSYGLISAIPVFGWFLWFIISLIHLLGIIQVINRE